MAGAMLGPRYGALSVFLYVLIGLVGFLLMDVIVRRYPGHRSYRLRFHSSLYAEDLAQIEESAQGASSFAAVDLAYGKIASGQADFLIAGGTESSSLAPEKWYALRDPRSRRRPRQYHAAQFIPKEDGDKAMLLGAERTARQAGVFRDEADLAADEAACAVITRAGLTYRDVSAFEYNEAFSGIDVLFERAHPEMEDRLNVWAALLHMDILTARPGL